MIWRIKMKENTVTYKSPNKEFRFEFVYEGEIRFGPPFFKLILNGKLVKGRIFGEAFKWHNESNFLALQEWLTTDYKKGPITSLALIKLTTNESARIATANNGFIEPVKFEENLIVYNKNYYQTVLKEEFEINIEEIKNWEAIDSFPSDVIFY